MYSKDPQEEDKTTEWPGKEPEMRKGLDDSTVYEGHSHNWSWDVMLPRPVFLVHPEVNRVF